MRSKSYGLWIKKPMPAFLPTAKTAELRRRLFCACRRRSNNANGSLSTVRLFGKSPCFDIMISGCCSGSADSAGSAGSAGSAWTGYSGYSGYSG